MSNLCQGIAKRRKEMAKKQRAAQSSASTKKRKKKKSAASSAEDAAVGSAGGIGEVFEQRDKSLNLLGDICRDALLETLVERAGCGKFVQSNSFYYDASKIFSKEEEGEEASFLSFADLEAMTQKQSSSVEKRLTNERNQCTQNITNLQSKISACQDETKFVDRDIAALEKRLVDLKARKSKLSEQTRTAEDKLLQEKKRLGFNTTTSKRTLVWQKEEKMILRELKEGDRLVCQVESDMLEKCQAEARAIVDKSLSSSAQSSQNHGKKKANKKTTVSTRQGPITTGKVSAQTFVHRTVAEAVMFVDLQEQCHKFLADRIASYNKRRSALNEESQMLSSLGMTLGTNLDDLKRRMQALMERETEDRNVLLTLSRQTFEIYDRLDRLRRLIEENARNDSDYQDALATARGQFARILTRLEPILFRNGSTDVDVMVDSGGWDVYVERVKKTVAAELEGKSPVAAIRFRPPSGVVTSTTSDPSSAKRRMLKSRPSSSFSSSVRNASKRSQTRRARKPPTSERGGNTKGAASTSNKSTAELKKKKKKKPPTTTTVKGTRSTDTAANNAGQRQKKSTTPHKGGGSARSSAKGGKTNSSKKPKVKAASTLTRSSAKGGKTNSSKKPKVKAASTPTKAHTKSTPVQVSQTKTRGGGGKSGSVAPKKKTGSKQHGAAGPRPSSKRHAK
eukprot:g707.t1